MSLERSIMFWIPLKILVLINKAYVYHILKTITAILI